MCGCLERQRAAGLRFLRPPEVCVARNVSLGRALADPVFSSVAADLFAIGHVQFRLFRERARVPKEARKKFRHNGFRTDMFAFGKTVVELLGGMLRHVDDEVVGTNTKNQGICGEKAPRWP